jgi:hypothetical protein
LVSVKYSPPTQTEQNLLKSPHNKTGGDFFMLNSDKEMNREKWSKYIQVQENSGISQRKWCEANQVNHHNFRYWRQRLKREDTNINQAGMNATTQDAERFEFAEVLVQPEIRNGAATIATPMLGSIQLEISGMFLTIPETYTEGFLLRLIRTLNRL